MEYRLSPSPTGSLVNLLPAEPSLSSDNRQKHTHQRAVWISSEVTALPSAWHSVGPPHTLFPSSPYLIGLVAKVPHGPKTVYEYKEG